MKYNINLSIGGHAWEKVNLVTRMAKEGGYDVLKCKHCGIQGKTSSLTSIMLKGSYSHDKVYNCPNNHKATKIQITICTALGTVFENLTPGSIHDVIAPPPMYSNDKGTWVMGNGEPVKILPHEFKILN